MEITFPAVNIDSTVPQLIVALFAILALLVEVFSRSSRMVFATCLVGLHIALLRSLMQWGRGIPYESSLLAVDGYTTFFNILFILIAMSTLAISLTDRKSTRLNSSHY